MAQKEKSLKESLRLALWDTLEVALWAGIPATGVAAYLELFQQDVPQIAAYAPIIAAGINLIAYFLKRLVGHKRNQL